jgi:UDP-3-O-acyl N-acetylglucosamine deacetylase
MPGLDGMELLRRLREEPGQPQVIMLTGHVNIETAVQATRLGAFDFIEKPFSVDALLHAVNRALEDRARSTNGKGSAAETMARQTAMRRKAGVRPECTLGKSVIASGHGLHTGVKSGLILHPLAPGRGIVFTNLSSASSVPAHLDYVESTGYATTLHHGGVSVGTVEHLLATFHAYGITNVLVKVQSEVPAMDGSAREFCSLIESAGIEEQGGGVDEIAVSERIVVEGEGEESIAIEPADSFEVSYTLVYPEPVGTQEYAFVLRDRESFRDEIAPARTFGFVEDMKAMASMGLASGGRLDNCILIDEEKVVNTSLRFPEELARHKILDIIGDLYLLGRPIRGRVTARMTGHSDNIALLRKLREHLSI